MKIQPEINEYEVYRNKEFGVLFEYPKNWNIEVQKPTSGIYTGGIIIQIKGPKEGKTGVGYTVLSLWIVPKKQFIGEFTSLKDYTTYSIKKNSVGTSRILTDDATTISGFDAREISISFDTYRPPRILREFQKLVVSITKWVVMQSKSYFFELKFHSSEDDFLKFVEVYNHAKSTFRFI